MRSEHGFATRPKGILKKPAAGDILKQAEFVFVFVFHLVILTPLAPIRQAFLPLIR